MTTQAIQESPVTGGPQIRSLPIRDARRMEKMLSRRFDLLHLLTKISAQVEGEKESQWFEKDRGNWPWCWRRFAGSLRRIRSMCRNPPLVPGGQHQYRPWLDHSRLSPSTFIRLPHPAIQYKKVSPTFNLQVNFSIVCTSSSRASKVTK